MKLTDSQKIARCCYVAQMIGYTNMVCKDQINEVIEQMKGRFSFAKFCEVANEVLLHKSEYANSSSLPCLFEVNVVAGGSPCFIDESDEADFQSYLDFTEAEFKQQFVEVEGYTYSD